MENWELDGRPLGEVLEEAQKLKELRERRVLSVNWLPGEYWGKNNEVATRDSIRAFANATGDSNPLWKNPEYAKKTQFGGIIAPPLYLNFIAPGWGVTLFKHVGDKWLPTLGMVQAANAGARWVRFHEVREGDSFNVYDVFKDVELKKKHTPEATPMFVSQVDRNYGNQRGELVAICSMRTIKVATHLHQKDSLSPEEENQKFKPYRYTDAELKSIKEAYAAEERRGAKTRFWEDVSEGEVLKPVIKGPVLTDDAVAFMGAIGLMQRAYGLRDESLHQNNLEDNTPTLWQTMHVYDVPVYGRPSGRNMPTIAGAQMETWLSHLITNWMGDDGFLKVLDSQHRRPCRFRDTYRCYGKVLKKYIENGEHLVDIDIWTEDQQGIRHTTAKATVRLVSKA